MTEKQFERLIERADEISSRLWWIAFWLFIIAISQA